MALWNVFGSTRTAGRPRTEPVLTPRASLENPSVSLSEADGTWLADWATGGTSQTFGPAINERTALTIAAVHRAVTLRSGVVAGIGLKVYQTTPDGRREAREHRVASLLKTAPYPGRQWTSLAWLEQTSMCIDLYGNAFSVIRYDNAARVIGFEPFLPWLVEIRRIPGRTLYIVTREDGSREGIDQEDMLHFVGPVTDGVQGLSRIQAHARDSLALTKVLEQQTGRAHENAARPSGILTVPRGIQKPGMDRLKAQFNEGYAGRENAGKVFFTDEGTTYTPLQLTPIDLATIDSRRYQTSEVANWFGVPLHLLNETDKSSSWGSGIAEQNMGWLCYSMNADLGRIEAEVNYKVFAGTSYYVEFNRAALMEMDPEKSARVMQTQIASGIMTINEARAMLNRSPVDGGDKPLVNSTNVPLERQLAAPQPAPTPDQKAPANA